MKKLIAIFLIILISILIITSIVKLIKNLSLNYNDKNFHHLEEGKNSEVNLAIPKWIKHDYWLPNGSWLRQNNTSPLVIGKKYFLIEMTSNKERCFLGMVFLKKIQKNDLLFKTNKSYSISRLKQYSRIKSIKITTIILSIEEQYFSGKIQNCSEWVKIEND